MSEKLTQSEYKDVVKILSESRKIMHDKFAQDIRPADDFGYTVKEWAAEFRCSQETARVTMKRGIADGILEKKKVVWDGHIITLYYPTGMWTDGEKC